MRYLKIILIGIFAVAVAVQATGGAAALVAKKSITGEFVYSDATKLRFMHECSENASQRVCECVLARLQNVYSEDEYTKYDSQLRRGGEDYEFTSFISNAVDMCDAEFTKDTSVISEEKARAFIDSLFKYRKKKDFVADCAPHAKELLGNNGANKACGCMYDQMIRDTSRLVQAVMDNNFFADSPLWALDFAVDCMPDKMTPEIKKYFVNRFNQAGVPKSIGQCIIDNVAKEYSMKTFLQAAMSNDGALDAVFIMMGTKCALEKMQ